MAPILQLFIATILSLTTAQQCSIPSNGVLTTLLNGSLIDEEGIDPAELTNLTITNKTFTCLATSEFIHKYRTTAVVLEYRINTTSILEYAYIDAQCDEDIPVEVWSVVELNDADETYLNLNLRVDCYVCTEGFNDHHCLACDSSCGVSGRCTGSGDGDCCPVFDNGVCDSACPDKFAPDENDFFQCVCNISCPAGYEPSLLCDECNYTSICLAEEPCQNGGQCVLDDSPTDYQCECTDYYTGTNCTDCSLSCKDGYSPSPTCSQCIITDICLALSPCTNGGTCVLTTPPESYNCTCINHYEPSSNCTNCALNCKPGYAPDTDCTECVLSDICQASMPCQNEGTCVLGPAPDSYSCICTNRYEPSSNCTNCALNCMLGFIPDPDCTQCLLRDICEASMPCQNGGTCVLGSASDQFSCNCHNHFNSKLNCSECSLTCNTGFVANENCSECILSDLCLTMNPCANNGSCSIPLNHTASPDQYQCDCHYNETGYSGTNCTECSIPCTRGYVAVEEDGRCICQLADICEAEQPCMNGGTCSILDSFPDQRYQCECLDLYTNTTNCTEKAQSSSTINFKWWMVFIPAVAVLLIAVMSICVLSLGHQYSHKKKQFKIAPI